MDKNTKKEQKILEEIRKGKVDIAKQEYLFPTKAKDLYKNKSGYKIVDSFGRPIEASSIPDADKDMGYAFSNLRHTEKIDEVLERLEQAEGKINDIEKNEQRILVCGKLKFNLDNGDAIYNKTEDSFKPDTDEYKLLKALMEKPNIRLSYDEINTALGKGEHSKKDKRDISFIVKNIKNKLKITGKEKKRENKNLFKARNGYLINYK